MKKHDKTSYCSVFLETGNLCYLFIEIENNVKIETKLRNLYENKKIRNPSVSALQK